MTTKPIVKKATKTVKKKVTKKSVKPKRPPRPEGRPTLLKPELQEEMLNLFRLGNYAVFVCGVVGISETNYYNWMARGRDEYDRMRLADSEKAIPNEVKYLEFFVAVEKSKSEGTVRIHNAIMKEALSGDWKAGAWMLSRTRPDLYSEKINAELSTGEGKPLEVSVSIEELEKKVNAVIAQRKS